MIFWTKCQAGAIIDPPNKHIKRDFIKTTLLPPMPCDV
jgi:hypothetical protein